MIPSAIMATPFRIFDVLLVPVAAASDWATNGPQNPQDRADHQQDDPDCLQHSELRDEKPYDKQDDTQDNHDASIPTRSSIPQAGIELGCGK
jgi:hypothetical protein